jgi:hypothetical protein
VNGFEAPRVDRLADRERLVSRRDGGFLGRGTMIFLITILALLFIGWAWILFGWLPSLEHSV